MVCEAWAQVNKAYPPSVSEDHFQLYVNNVLVENKHQQLTVFIPLNNNDFNTKHCIYGGDLLILHIENNKHIFGYVSGQYLQMLNTIGSNGNNNYPCDTVCWANIQVFTDINLQNVRLIASRIGYLIKHSNFFIS